MRTCSISAAFLIVAGISFVPVLAAEQGVQDKGDGLRVMHVGNSHSHALRFLEPLAWAVGHKKHKDGDVNILGAPLRWNWGQPIIFAAAPGARVVIKGSEVVRGKWTRLADAPAA